MVDLPGRLVSFLLFFFFGGDLVCFERAVLAFLSSEMSARAVLMTMMMLMLMSWVLRWFDARLLPITTL